MNPDWIPVRRGSIYCSPSCGNKCTYGEYEQAAKRSRKLANRFGKNTFIPKVWENFGWHSRVDSRDGILRIHILPIKSSSKVSYMASFDHSIWSYRSNNPEKAVEGLLSSLMTEIDHMNSLRNLCLHMLNRKKQRKVFKEMSRELAENLGNIGQLIKKK